MDSCFLSDRTIVSVSGDDAETLLNRLFTRSVVGMTPGEARYAALLSPQGKLQYDFIVVRRPESFWLDCRADQSAALAKALTQFRLRAKAAIAIEPDLRVVATWGGTLLEAPGPAYRDPRHNELGYRYISREDATPASDRTAYDRHRISLGVPEGGTDWPYGDTFVHDANLDLLHGVDFDKGCYVGQEVVSRVHHRNSARKRFVRLHFFGEPPASGADVTAGGTVIGHVTSLAAPEGLAAVRIDRLAEAEATASPVLAGETLVGITMPSPSPVRAPTYADDDAIF